MKKAERRGWKRVEADPAAKIHITGATRTVFPEVKLACHLINISPRGVQFSSTVAFTLREKLDLEIQVPSWKKTLVLEGEVVWVQTVPGQGVRIGARYLKVAPQALRKLTQLASGNAFSG